jgi:hypothetical protein
VLLGALGAARWLRGHEAPAMVAPDRLTPAPALHPPPEVPVSASSASGGAPSVTVLPVPASGAPTVGESAPAPTQTPLPPIRHKATPQGELDDVGDPFATKH